MILKCLSVGGYVSALSVPCLLQSAARATTFLMQGQYDD